MGRFDSADSFVVLAAGACCCVCRSLVSPPSNRNTNYRRVRITNRTGHNGNEGFSLNVTQTSLNNVQCSSRTSPSVSLFTDF